LPGLDSDDDVAVGEPDEADGQGGIDAIVAAVAADGVRVDASEAPRVQSERDAADTCNRVSVTGEMEPVDNEAADVVDRSVAAVELNDGAVLLIALRDAAGPVAGDAPKVAGLPGVGSRPDMRGWGQTIFQRFQQ